MSIRCKAASFALTKRRFETACNPFANSCGVRAQRGIEKRFQKELRRPTDPNVIPRRILKRVSKVTK
jgi:hypothetical protein